MNRCMVASESVGVVQWQYLFRRTFYTGLDECQRVQKTQPRSGKQRFIRHTSAMTIYCLYIFDRYVRSLVCTQSIPQPKKSPARHCNCVYYHDWHRTKRPKRANDGGALLPGVSHALSPLPSTSSAAGTGSAPGSAPGTPFSSPRNTLAPNSGILVAISDGRQSPGLPASTATPPAPVQAQGGGAGSAASVSGLPFDEEAKLVYGVVLSLRNMVKRLSGRYVPPCLSFVSRLSSRSLSPVCPTRRVRRAPRALRRDESFVSYRTSTYKLHLFETVSGYRFVMLSDPNAESLRFVMRSIYSGPFLEYVVRNPLVPMDSHERGVDNEYFRASIDRLVRGLSVFQ